MSISCDNHGAVKIGSPSPSIRSGRDLAEGHDNDNAVLTKFSRAASFLNLSRLTAPRALSNFRRMTTVNPLPVLFKHLTYLSFMDESNEAQVRKEAS